MLAIMRFFLLFHVLQGRRKLFVILRTLSNSGSFYRGTTVLLQFRKKVGNAFHYLSVLIEELCLSALHLANV